MVQAVEFDFRTKVDRQVAPDGCAGAIAGGRYVWLDVDLAEPDAFDALRHAVPLEDELLDQIADVDDQARVEIQPEHLHLVAIACRVRAGELETQRISVLAGKGYLVTAHRGEGFFMPRVRAHYHDDFLQYAETPSFLLYEVLESLIVHFRAVARYFNARVETVQNVLFGEHVPESIFADCSRVQSDVLRFRKFLAPLREALIHLSMRRTVHVSEATRPYLASFAETIDRILSDALVNRDILSDSLNLYMSIVGYRTNQNMGRLTVISVIFLPLTFLCGVYGMNFVSEPELRWQYGYAWFWALVGIITLGATAILRRKKIL
ncbi:MAG TPA: magnesium transporter CorA family protein [Planctomycetota bacterium]|nr:magnesium transporter CorA family protein [Planctomycetota bacterium]